MRTACTPEDLRKLGPEELARLATEIRSFLVENVARTGGHLGPNLGVVELTLAVHRVFDSPHEPVVFDTGHQAYVHKIVTGRAACFDGLRRPGGISGYPCRVESEHDWVESSHASAALSYADGLAKAYELSGDPRPVVAVVGDGALTGGMCWEALNNIGAGNRPLVVVVNDNGRSYAPTVGGLAEHLAALRGGSGAHGEQRSVFEELGLDYLGPVDGHDVAALEIALRKARATGAPAVVHAVTQKGRGYAPAEAATAELMHQVKPMDPQTAEPLVPAASSWTHVFAEELVRQGERRPDVVAITAAMPGPTMLDRFAAAFPMRCFDVGIAEQHAVTSAAGLAMGGMHPVVAVYSTFLNRAFDQVVMDVGLHRLPVTLVLDRAGITGDDGASHNGVWDLSVLGAVPGLRIAAPRDGESLREEFAEALAVDDGPTCVRFAKGAVPERVPALVRTGGVAVLRRPGPAETADVLLVGVGALAGPAVEAGDRLAREGIGVTVVDPRWVAPVPAVLAELAAAHRLVVTVEDGGRHGGFGWSLAAALRDADVATPLRDLGVPRRYLHHAPRPELLAELGLTAPEVARQVAAWFARLPGVQPARNGSGGGAEVHRAGRQPADQHAAPVPELVRVHGE
ncbi:MAG: 1-deoxy-D-xylulose-5-phosphate synthase [Pseudonocardia sp.]|nr:1-deoxy-D-xylulose-5-phosphate synthase [Pseudonocardia sp.]